MGFKNINQIKKENEFIKDARGETNNFDGNIGKRERKALINFTNAEYDMIKQSANNMHMNVSQYIRFKLFNS